MKNQAVVVIPEAPKDGYPTTIEVQDVPIPEISDDEVLIAMQQVGICGSDVHYSRLCLGSEYRATADRGDPIKNYFSKFLPRKK